MTFYSRFVFVAVSVFLACSPVQQGLVNYDLDGGGDQLPDGSPDVPMSEETPDAFPSALDAPLGGSAAGGTSGLGGMGGVVATTGSDGAVFPGSTSGGLGTIPTGGNANTSGVTVPGGQMAVGGTTGAGGAPLAGTPGDSTVPSTGGTSSSGGVRASSASTSTVPPAISGLAVQLKKAIEGQEGLLIFNLRIDNRSLQTVDLSSVTMRYWYREEALGAAVILSPDYVSIGASNQGKVTAAKVVQLSPPLDGADRYLELSFSGTLAAYGDKSMNDQFTVNVAIHNAAYTGKNDVTNDYSYNEGAVGTNDKITLHSGGMVAWGTPPSSPEPINPDAGVVVSKPDAGPPSDATASTSVTFNAGLAKGAMWGYGWAAMGKRDIVSSPTCGPAKAPITPEAPCMAVATNWESSDALCISATIPALSSSAGATEYTENWGIQIGVDAGEASSGVGKAYRTIALNFTGTPQTGVRATVHRSGDPAGTTYCAPVTSGLAIPFTNFNTACRDGSGTSLAATDVPGIDKLGLEVLSSSSEIVVNKLCLTSVAFGL